MSRNRELSQFPEFLTVNDTYGSVGIGTSLTVSGLGTFANDLYVGGTLYAPSLNITGGATLGDDLVTRNISASGIVTVTGTTDLNGDLDVDGHTELDNVRISGITTFESNIYLGNSDKVIMGGGDSFQLYHDGSNSYIVDSGAGDLYLRGTAAINFQNAAGTEDYAKFNVDGATELYYDNSKKLETTTGGISVSGNIVASGNVTVGGTLIYEDVTNVDSVGIATARAGLRITGGGLDVVGVATFNNGVNTLDVIGHTELDQLRVSGVSTFTGNIDANGDLDVDGHTELDNVNISGIVTTFDLDVEGHTELDNVNVSGVSTFVGIVTSQSDVFVGNNLSVAGDARIVGVLTVGSASVTLNGDTNTITVGHGVTIHTTTASVNQLEVSGLSTFTGIGTFRSDLYVGGTLYTPDLVVDGSSVGNDITTRNISASGIVTVTGNTDLNGDLDVDGHTELDNLNVSGVSTFVGVSTFQDNVVFDSTGSIQVPKGDTSQRPTGVLGQIRYNIEQSTFEGFGAGNAWGSLGGVKDVNQDTYIIPELSAGSNEDTLYFYNAGSNTATISSTTATVNVDFAVTGVSTFTGNIDANGNLDVDGHTELDNVRISGFLTATSAEFSGNVTVLGDLTYENVTNVDAIGIATARSGLRITGGGLDVTGIATFNDGANVASGNTYKVNGVDVLSATTLGSNVVNSSLTSLGAGVISNRTELTIGQPSGGDYILLYDADAGDLKKATISNAALQGVQGIQGVQGTQGIQGTQGVQGIQGVQGTQGIQGTQGVQGTFGTQGTQGIQGIEAPTTFTISSKSSAYQLVLLDSGKLISITTGGVTVPSGTFSGGESVMIYNNSASSQTITQGSGMTLRLPGTADTGNRTLQQRGIVTVLFLSSSEALISGSGLL